MAVCCAPLRMQLDVAVQELGDVRMPVKKLLLLVDLARQGLQPGQEDVSLQRWTAVVQDLGIQ
jgi:vesicle-fusing ATPase